jgi:hypothetical protein
MSDGWLIVSCFLSCVVASAFVISAAIKASRSKVTRWDGNSTSWFIMTIGNFGAKHIDSWRHVGGYNEDQARIITRHQMLCVFGMFLAYVGSVAGALIYKIATH